MKRIRFIINPKAGTGKKENIPELIHSLIDASRFQYDICFTEAAGHAIDLAASAVGSEYDLVIAVGGDGSVNEAASPLKNTRTAIGIIPLGSGNGLARHLGIPMKVEDAIRTINTGRIEHMDTLEVNGRFCAGTIGVGFDAHIAHMFSKVEKRGYSTYVKLVLTEFSNYGEKHFSILVDGKPIERDCFLLTFANSSQFGNNAVIAPSASVTDGIIDITRIARFPFMAAPSLIYRLMNNSIHKSKFFESFRGKSILVNNKGTIPGHIDGEPLIFTGDIKIDVHPKSLLVLRSENKVI